MKSVERVCLKKLSYIFFANCLCRLGDLVNVTEKLKRNFWIFLEKFLRENPWTLARKFLESQKENLKKHGKNMDVQQQKTMWWGENSRRNTNDKLFSRIVFGKAEVRPLLPWKIAIFPQNENNRPQEKYLFCKTFMIKLSSPRSLAGHCNNWYVLGKAKFRELGSCTENRLERYLWG